MGGKKKKSLANKLAKMSDEERARYLQHRADVEEEAKRRKEQLIATFMKKKIKKEEAFSRLNLAKINQHWHQILRKSKCKEMKENVEHMKKWIDGVITYKNRTISKLMQELEEAEEQYLNNFQSHSNHIENIIDEQNQLLDVLQEQYDDDLDNLMTLIGAEIDSILKKGKEDIEYLKTVFHGQTTTASKDLRASHENYMQRCYEAESEFQTRLQQLSQNLSKISGGVWRDIAKVVAQYVKDTDKRRAHLLDLKRLDAESAAEIEENRDKISKEEELIARLKEHHAGLTVDHDAETKSLEQELEDLNKEFFKARKTLQLDLQTDEKKLRLLSELSNKSLDHLNGLTQRMVHIKNLANTCKKFQTERENVMKYLPTGRLQIRLKDESDEKDEEGEGKKEEDKSKVGRPLPKLRPKTALTSRFSPETPIGDPKNAVKTITIQEKVQADLFQAPEPIPTSTGVFEKCYGNLKNLEKFWETYNKVEVDAMEIKCEKRRLEKENKQLRGMIRAVLEAVVLEQSAPQSRVSTRLPSRTRSAYSLPPRRIVA